VVLQHRTTNETFLLKEYTFAAEAHFNAKLKALQTEVEAGPREYIVSVVKAEGKAFHNFCSTCFKVYALFEYPQVTLH
jgi:DNA topoisomerase IB